MSNPTDVEIAHQISTNPEEQENVIPDLYVCLDECYVYSECGDDNGFPRDDADIVYDTSTDEIIQLDVETRMGKYVRCKKPIEGWVYLPKPDAQYDWGLLDDIYQEKLTLKREKQEAEAKAKEDRNVKKDPKDEDANYKEYGNMGLEEKQELKGDLVEPHTPASTKADDSHLIILEERRDYTQQRMMMQTVAPELESHEINKLMQIKLLRWLTFYFRRNPFLPGLIILCIQLFIETIILFDVYSDGMLAKEIYYSGMNIAFAISSAFICAPYVIAWTAASAMNAKKLKQNKDSYLQIIGCMMFNIAPIGITFLFMVDIYHWFECVFIKPIFYLFTCGKQIRTISYGELGYYKLRRVSEIFAEAMPQAVIQLIILVQQIRYKNVEDAPGCSKCTPLSVLQALASSFFVLIFWCAILKFEGKKNGMGFVEYVTVVFQGSFNFVEMLPAIERGTETGEKVNWTMYKFGDEGVGHVAKALNSPHCRLSLLKISKYTIKDLDRFGCRFLGGALAQCQVNIELIVSRLEEEIIQLFHTYDTDKGKSLDFEEFVHLCLDIKQNMREPCLRSDVFLIYEELADSVQHEVWQLDLQVKIKGSLEFIGLLDYNLPLQHAFENGDLKLISLLMAYQYEQRSDENMAEFEWCVAEAVSSGKVREAMCLCEHKGVPLVIRLVNGRDLLAMDDDGASDPYARISIFDQQKQSNYRKQTLNPNWDEDLLFIIPFEFMERLVNLKSVEVDNDIKQHQSWMNKQERKTTNRGLSYATMNLSEATVTGLAMPAYAMDAITTHLQMEYGQEFKFDTAESYADLNAAHEAGSNGKPQVNKQLTTEPVSDRVLSIAAAHSDARRHSKFDKNTNLNIRIRVFDHDAEDDDDFMGSYKGKYNMKDDTAKFHEDVQSVQLQYLHGTDEEETNAGSISFRVFLNVVQMYQDHGLHYIDSEHADKKLQIFKTEITEARPVSVGATAVFQM